MTTTMTEKATVLVERIHRDDDLEIHTSERSTSKVSAWSTGGSPPSAR